METCPVHSQSGSEQGVSSRNQGGGHASRQVIETDGIDAGRRKSFNTFEDPRLLPPNVFEKLPVAGSRNLEMPRRSYTLFQWAA